MANNPNQGGQQNQGDQNKPGQQQGGGHNPDQQRQNTRVRAASSKVARTRAIGRIKATVIANE